MDSEGSYNPKQAREQKVRRDRRRKDNRRSSDAPNNVEPENVSSVPKGQREPSNRLREHKLAPSAEPKKPEGEGTAAEKTEPPELPDFSNLKRETDEIAALTSKKYSKRQIFSNWTKYENPPEVHSDEEEEGRRGNFEDLAHLPASAGGHFKFKSEHSWDVNPSSLYAEYFSVNVESLAQGLACIPFYDKLDLPKELLAAEELERIDYFAKQSAARYNVTKASLTEGTYMNNANNHINKILNILSYKENQANKTDPSMYENVDEDDQLENKSLVQFSFEVNPVDQPAANVEVCMLPKSLSGNGTAGREIESSALPDNYPDPSDVGKPQELNLPQIHDSAVVTDVACKQTPVQQEDSKKELREISPVTNTLGEKITTAANHTEEVPCDETAWEEKVEAEEPVILEQRTGKGKKGSARGKNKKDEKKGKIEVNNVVNKKVSVVQSANLVSRNPAESVEETKVAEEVEASAERTIAQSVVEAETWKTGAKSSVEVGKQKFQEKVVETEASKPVDHVSKKTRSEVKKIPLVDEDLDFLLSLKKPVDDVKPKIVPPNKPMRSAIEEDEADSALPPVVPLRVVEENLEDWLDSMLDD